MVKLTEYAIAIPLEQLAVMSIVNIDWDAVKLLDSGEPILKHYHVIWNFERIADEESKFDAMHNTRMGNLVVEDAKITVIDIDPDIPIDTLYRS